MSDNVFFSDDYKKFFDSNFDAKVYTTNIMQGMSIANQLKKISDGLELLDKELHNQVKKEAVI